MHFIQSDWFYHHFIWVLFVCILLFTIGAYLNNRIKLTKKLLIASFISFLFCAGHTIQNSESPFALNTPAFEIPQKESIPSKTPTIFNRIIDILLSILKEKSRD